jgi:hypothetical protein
MVLSAEMEYVKGNTMGDDAMDMLCDESWPAIGALLAAVLADDEPADEPTAECE